MSARSGKAWFCAQGQSVASRGLPIQASPLWPHRNDMPYWAYVAFMNGYESQCRAAGVKQ